LHQSPSDGKTNKAPGLRYSQGKWLLKTVLQQIQRSIKLMKHPKMLGFLLCCYNCYLNNYMLLDMRFTVSEILY